MSWQRRLNEWNKTQTYMVSCSENIMDKNHASIHTGSAEKLSIHKKVTFTQVQQNAFLTSGKAAGWQWYGGWTYDRFIEINAIDIAKETQGPHSSQTQSHQRPQGPD